MIRSVVFSGKFVLCEDTLSVSVPSCMPKRDVLLVARKRWLFRLTISAKVTGERFAAPASISGLD